MIAIIDIPVRLDQPWALAALPLIALPVLLAVLARRRRRRLSPWSVVAQCVALLLAVLAMANPQLPGGEATRPWLLLRDVSASMRGQTDRPLNPPEGMAVEERHFARNVLPNDGTPPSDAIDATHATPALDLAASRASDLAGVVILTDGRFQDHWQAAAARLAETGLDALIVPLDAPPRDARITRFHATRRDANTVDLTLSAAANGMMQQTLVVMGVHGTGFAATADLTLTSDRPATLRFRDTQPDGTSIPRYLAILGNHNADRFPANNRMTALAEADVPTIGTIQPPRTLSIDLAALLKPTPMHIESIPEDNVTNQIGMYHAVVLATQNGWEMNLPQQQALADYVRGGGTLVLLGTGPRETPADIDAPLNRIAALAPNPFERSPLDLVVVLDASGSMAAELLTDTGRRVKFDLAAGAVLALRRHLTARDRLRVITFADDATTIYDSGEAGPDFGLLAEALRNVKPAGPTHVDTALEQAVATPPADSRQGLVLVLSDLDTREFNVHNMADLFRRQDWQLALVGTGDAYSKRTPLFLLKDMLDGLYRHSPDLKDLAELFGSLTRQGRGDDAVAAPLKIDTSADWKMLTGLSAMNLTPTASTENAEVLATANGEPLLGRRRVGLGWSWTLPVELGNFAWASPDSQTALRAMLAAILRQTPTTDNAFLLETEFQGRQLAITITAAPNAPSPDSRELLAEIAPLDSDNTSTNPITVDLPQVALGRYRAAVDLDAASAGIVVRDRNSNVILARTIATRSYPREFARLGADPQTLEALAAATGGRLVSLDDAPVHMRDRIRRTERPAWPYLLAAALAVMLLDWALGRITNRA